MNYNEWIIVPSNLYRNQWMLYRNAYRLAKQDYKRDKNGFIVHFTTRSGARGVRSRLRHSGEMSA